MSAWSWVAVALLALIVGIWFRHSRPPRPPQHAKTESYVCEDCDDRDCSCRRQTETTPGSDRPKRGNRA